MAMFLGRRADSMRQAKGLTILTPEMTAPACMSSDSSSVQPDRAAASTIKAS